MGLGPSDPRGIVDVVLRDAEQQTLATRGRKRCRTCDRIGPHSQFTKARRSGDGLSYRCKACDREKGREDRARRIKANEERDPYADQSARLCRRCGCRKPRAEFAIQRTAGDGLQSYCKPCSVERWQERTYGRAVKPGESCEACGSAERLCVDHDHGTGAVRGILCGPCNRAAGQASDDPARLEALARYLRRADPT